MIVIQASREEMADAARVAANVQLGAVFLVSVQAINKLAGDPQTAPVELNARVSHRYVGHRVHDQKTLFLEVGARVELRRKKSDNQDDTNSEPEVIFDVIYGAAYALPQPPVPPSITDSSFTAFARINGLHNCWPYLREEIHRLGAAMNFPFLLPTLRIVTKVEDAGSQKKEETTQEKQGRLPELSAARTPVRKHTSKKRP